MSKTQKLLQNLYYMIWPEDRPEPKPKPKKVSNPNSLGAILREKERKEKELADQLEKEKLEAVQRQIAADALVIRRFFEAVKVSFTHDIRNGQKPIPVLIPKGAPFNTHTWYRDIMHYFSPNHPNKEEFVKFFEWVKENELYVGMKEIKESEQYMVYCWMPKPL